MFFLKPIALASGVGGLCIDSRSLAKADIIVSTKKGVVSDVIRIGTASVVSHAALYVGGELVIEAIGAGVTRHSIADALRDDALAVAYRHPSMRAAIADKIIAFAAKQIGKAYDMVGAGLAGLSSSTLIPFSLERSLLCRIAGPRPATFYCSKLVAEAYRQGGLPLTIEPSQCVTPEDVVEIAAHRLTYVGHLLGKPSWFPVLAPG